MVLAIAVTICATSCEKESQPVQNDTNEPVSWTPDNSEMTILTGEKTKVWGTVAWSNGESSPGFEAINLNADDGSCVWTYGGWEMVGLAPGTSTVKANVRMGGWWKGKREFYQDIKVNVVYPEETITGLKISPERATIKHGEEIKFTIYAVYASGTREIAPVVCKFDVTDDGVQHIACIFDGNKAYVGASQGKGETYIKATYTENGKTVEAHSTIESVL